jgi:hypothetical protein
MKPAALPDRARNTSKLNNPVNRDDSDAIWGNFSTKPLALSAEFVAQRSQAILPSPSAAKVCGWISAVVNEFIRYAYARLARIDLTSLSVTFAKGQCLYHFTIYALL